jgi:hypothetical protein
MGGGHQREPRRRGIPVEQRVRAPPVPARDDELDEHRRVDDRELVLSRCRQGDPRG